MDLSLVGGVSLNLLSKVRKRNPGKYLGFYLAVLGNSLICLFSFCLACNANQLNYYLFHTSRC